MSWAKRIISVLFALNFRNITSNWIVFGWYDYPDYECDDICEYSQPYVFGCEDEFVCQVFSDIPDLWPKYLCAMQPRQ